MKHGATVKGQKTRGTEDDGKGQGSWSMGYGVRGMGHEAKRKGQGARDKGHGG